MPKGMATKGVTGKQHDVDRENGGAHTDAERTFSGGGIDKPKGFPDIVGQNPKEEEKKIEKITVQILNDERERTFTTITFALFFLWDLIYDVCMTIYVGVST